MGHERMGSSGRGGGRGAAGGGGGGMERKKYPIRAEDYELYEEIGEGVSASVYCAKCIPFNEIVAVKILDLEKNRNSDLNNISREAQTMVLVNHPNLLNAHCSFASDKTLWVVMPYMRGGSCLNVLKSAYPDGFEEVVIATILREVLKGLEYLHTQGHIHRDIKAGNILLDASAGVKLGDFGVSASLYDSGDRQRMRNTFVGTPCWMAPEVMEQLHGYDFKADIWSFGITALELAHGHAPFSKYPPMKVFLMTMQNAPPSLNYERDRKYTKNFRHMIALCLLKDPSKRPTAHKLLKHSFFKQARSNEYIDRNLLDGLPLLADRIKALKVKEQDMLDQKKMPDGKKEQLSQNEYKRGISCWNFDIEDLKVQSSLVQDDDYVDDKYTCGSASSIFEIGSLQLNRSPSVSSASCSSRDELERDNNELMQGKTTTATISDQLSASQRMNSNGVDRGISLSSSSSRSAPPNVFDCLDNEIETELSEICGTETNYGRAKYHERKGTCAPLDVPRRLFKEESGLPRAHSQNGEICNGALTPTANGSLSETIYKASRPSASAEETDAKSKVPVVQQKGRFKVTSENIEVEKVPSLPGIPKSLSFQAIPQVSAFNLSSPVAAKPNIIGSKLFQQLQCFLQDNTNMRDHILNAMKQAVAGDFSAPANQATDGVSVQSAANTTEKSLLVQLEAANEKEKELVQQVADLQWRLLCVQEELQKLKVRSS